MKNDRIDMLSNEMKKAIIETCFDEIQDYLYENKPITIQMTSKAQNNIEQRWKFLNEDNKISYNNKVRGRWVGSNIDKVENGIMSLVGNFKNVELLYTATSLDDSGYTIGQLIEGSYIEEKYVDYRLELDVKYEEVVIKNFEFFIENK